jgi:hypothetical protein
MLSAKLTNLVVSSPEVDEPSFEYRLMFIERIIRQAKSCAPLGGDQEQTAGFQRLYRWLISWAPPAHTLPDYLIKDHKAVLKTSLP